MYLSIMIQAKRHSNEHSSHPSQRIFFIPPQLDIVIETNLAAIKALEAVHKKLFRYGNFRYEI